MTLIKMTLNNKKNVKKAHMFSSIFNAPHKTDDFFFVRIQMVRNMHGVE